MDQVTVFREAEVADVPSLVMLMSSVARLHSEAHPARFRTAQASELEPFVTGLLDEPDDLVGVADRDGLVIGYIWGRLERRGDGLFTAARTDVTIHHLAVEPAARRQGVAGALMELVRSWASERGADGLDLQVWAFNSAASLFFEACGYTSHAQWMGRQLR